MPEYIRRAVPATPKKPEPIPTKAYEVLSANCAWGKPGEVIMLTLTEGQELSLIQAGTVKPAAKRPSPAAKGD